MGISPVLCGGFIEACGVCYFGAHLFGTHWNPGCGTERPANLFAFVARMNFLRAAALSYDADQKQEAKSSGGIGISGSLCLRITEPTSGVTCGQVKRPMIYAVICEPQEGRHGAGCAWGCF